MGEQKAYTPPKGGRPKAYNPEQLEKAVNKYFRKITRVKPVTELVPTGETDKYGHPIMMPAPVINQDGEQVQKIEYLVPPCVASLCEFLGIHRDTWNSYCQNPEYSDTTSRARGRFQSYLELENLQRDDKHLKGIQFDLVNNYNCRNAKVDVAAESMEDYLARITEAGGSQDF